MVGGGVGVLVVCKVPEGVGVTSGVATAKGVAE